jgi:hypothetical protein
LSGYSYSAWNGPGGVAPVNAHAGSADQAVIRLANNGDYLWHTFHGSGSTDFNNDMVMDGSRNIYVVGYGNSPWYGPGLVPPQHAFTGGNDMVALKLWDGLLVTSITRNDTNPAFGATVAFTVTFNESASNVDMADFALTAPGITGANIASVVGSGASYTVTVNTGTGDGTIRLDVVDDDSILDATGSPLGGAGAGNGNFVNGEVYTVVKSAPILYSPAAGEVLHTNRPTFDWSDFPAAVGYHIQVSRNNTFTQVVSNTVIRTATSTFTPTLNLTSNAVLYWRVRAKMTLTTYGGWSEVRSFTTGNPPSAPTLASPANNALVVGPAPLFNWNNSTVPLGTTFDHYQIQVATDNAFAAIVYDHDVAGVTNSQDNGAALNAGVTYYWRVRSFNTLGDYSAWSVVRSLRIKYDPPILSLPANGATGIALKPTFTWSATIGATSYNLQVSRNATFTQIVVNKTVYTPTFTATTNLLTGITYYWRVRVNGPYGPSNWSLVFSFTTQ